MYTWRLFRSRYVVFGGMISSAMPAVAYRHTKPAKLLPCCLALLCFQVRFSKRRRLFRYVWSVFQGFSWGGFFLRCGAVRFGFTAPHRTVRFCLCQNRIVPHHRIFNFLTRSKPVGPSKPSTLLRCGHGAVRLLPLFTEPAPHHTISNRTAPHRTSPHRMKIEKQHPHRTAP